MGVGDRGGVGERGHSITICCLSHKLSSLSVNPFWEELCQSGKQTRKSQQLCSIHIKMCFTVHSIHKFSKRTAKKFRKIHQRNAIDKKK